MANRYRSRFVLTYPGKKPMIKGLRNSYWATVVRIFAAISMVLVMAGHSVFGCHWHHAHASDAACDSCPVVVHHDDSDHDEHGSKDHTARCGHEHQDGEKPLRSHDEPTPSPRHGVCDEADCVFVRTDSGKNLNLGLNHDFVTRLVSGPELLAADVCGSVAPSWSHYHCGKPPLRPHLLLQILLI